MMLPTSGIVERAWEITFTAREIEAPVNLRGDYDFNQTPKHLEFYDPIAAPVIRRIWAGATQCVSSRISNPATRCGCGSG